MFHSVGHKIKTRKTPMGGGICRIRALLPFLFLLIASTLCAVSGTGNAAVPDATGGEAAIDGFRVKEQKDGVGPFDKDDDRGNDSSDENLIVRSFDSVNYMLEYTTELIDQSKPATHGTSIYTEFTLPVSPEKARFDMDVMNWMLDKRLVYTYSDGTESETKDKTKTIVRQTLTGRRLLENKSNDDRVPGAGQLSVGIAIKGAANGTKIRPSFKIRTAGTAIEKTCEPQVITVSAAPRYNIEVKDNWYTNRNIIYADEKAGTVQLQEADGMKKGRVYGRSVALALWNTSADKGLKGIELPQGDITYDIQTTATLNGSESTDNGDWGVTLWDYKENLTSTRNGHLGKQMLLFGEGRSNYGAYNSVTNEWGDPKCSVYNGGTISTVLDKSNPSIGHVTISNYAFDTDNFRFPVFCDPYEEATYPKYPANIGYFSVGYFEYLARFPRSVDKTYNFYISTNVTNFNAKTISNDNCTTEQKTTDNTAGGNVVLYAPGDFTKYLYYDGSGQSNWGSGDGYAAPGTNSSCSGRMNYSGSEPLRSADFLLKFDTNILEALPGANITTSSPQTTIFTKDNVEIFYAVKADGGGWASDDEMQSTRQEQLLYFDSWEKLAASKKTCVAILYRLRRMYMYVTRDAPKFNLNYRVKDDAPNGYVAQILGEARAWHTANPGESLIGTNADGSIGTVMDSEYGNTKYVDGYAKPDYRDYTPYKKTTYANGTVSGGHTNGIHGGDSILIVSAKNRVNIEVADMTASNTKKSTYDLDAGERTATFKVSPAVDFASNNQSITGDSMPGTASVEVTLPVGLTYKSSTREPSSVKKNDDGTTTLVFDYQNVIAGKAIDAFNVACTIGYAGTDHDVQNNQQLTANAQITSTLDQRTPSKNRATVADSSIVVVRLAALSVSKFVSPSHGNLGCSHTWTLNFGNSSQTDVPNARIADIMPYVGDGRGTKFTGDYHVRKITLDLSKAPRIKASIGTQPIAYTSDAAVRKSDDGAIVSGAIPSSFKLLGSPTKSGDSLVWDGLDLTQEQLKAWRLDLPSMPGNEYISIAIDVDTADAHGNLYADSNGEKQQPDDIYANTFAEYADGQAAVVHSNVVTTTVKEAEISVAKKWKGDDGHERFRPDSIIAHVSGSDGSSHDLRPSSSNGWKDSIRGLAYYDAKGDKIAYTVSEPTVSDDYSSSIDGDSDSGFTITNTYTYDAKGTIHLKAIKKITGREFEKGDSMTFKAEESISPSSGAKATAMNGKEVTVTPTSGTQCEIDFGTVDIDGSFEGKTISYTIYEKSATGRGMSKDASRKTVSFTVTDPNHDHTLKVTQSGSTDTPVFTNTFTPSSSAQSITIGKTLTGRAWRDGETFAMSIEPKATGSVTKEQARASMPTSLPSFKKPADGGTSKATITGFSFPRAGLYEYAIRETVPSGAVNGMKDGLKYDTATITVSFNVTQDAKTGNLSTTVSTQRSDGKSGLAFTNRYAATGSFTVKGTKELTGRLMKKGEFTFDLLDSNGAVIGTATNAVDGSFSFKPIDVTLDDAGKTLRYTVRERKGTAGGVTYDSHDCAVTVKPTDNGDGTIATPVTYSDGGKASFRNSYNAVGTLQFDTCVKRITGRSFEDGDAMTFHLTGEVVGDASFTAPLPSGVDAAGNVTIRPTRGIRADIPLGSARVDSRYAGKTLRYTLTEARADARNLSIDKSRKTFEFTVTDKSHNGRLAIDTDSPSDTAFTDSFTPDPIDGSFTIKKRLDGRNWKAGETFDVKITPSDDGSTSKTASAEALGAPSKTVKLTAPTSGSGNGTATVPLHFTKPGTYVYDAVEAKAGRIENGMTYDKRKMTVTVSVAQDTDTDGRLRMTTVEYSTDTGEATDTFINSYASSGEIGRIGVKKELVGRKWRDGDSFKFRLSAGDDATASAIYSRDIVLPDEDTVTIGGKGDHSDTFGKIAVRKAGTYRFDVSELPHGIPGVDIAAKATVTVNAVDDGNGTIRCSFAGEQNLTFTDYYGKGESVSVPFVGSKALSHDGYDEVPDIAGKYAFALIDANGATVSSASNGKDGSIDFGKLTYTFDDLVDAQPDGNGKRAKTIAYTVKEDGSIDGIENDTDKTVTVTLTDDGNGRLSASTSGNDGSRFSFTNSFSASCDIPAIKGSKMLKDAPEGSDGTYRFRLSPADDATREAIDAGYLEMPDGATCQEASCKAGGEFEFQPMHATRAGTYSFTVSEIEPKDGTAVPGVRYDKTEYTLRYTVSENGTSEMDVTADGTNPESCDFVNTYEANGSVVMKASKALNGKALEDGEFEFELRDGDGNVISTARNDANGNIEFTPIEYTLEDVGTHGYTVREIPGDELGILYDEKIADISVDVSDNGDGTLLVDASYGGEKSGAASFHNSYTPPTVEDVMSDLVQTGIEAMPYIAAAAICATPAIARRRKRR